MKMNGSENENEPVSPSDMMDRSTAAARHGVHFYFCYLPWPDSPQLRQNFQKSWMMQE